MKYLYLLSSVAILQTAAALGVMRSSFTFTAAADEQQKPIGTEDIHPFPDPPPEGEHHECVNKDQVKFGFVQRSYYFDLHFTSSADQYCILLFAEKGCDRSTYNGGIYFNGTQKMDSAEFIGDPDPKSVMIVKVNPTAPYPLELSLTIQEYCGDVKEVSESLDRRNIVK